VRGTIGGRRCVTRRCLISWSRRICVSGCLSAAKVFRGADVKLAAPRVRSAANGANRTYAVVGDGPNRCGLGLEKERASEAADALPNYMKSPRHDVA
jgi:hypothetical protein